jgi:hypothetical protein
MSTALVPVADIEKMAVAIAKSKMFGMKTADEAFALMLIAQAEGMHPAIAARDYHIIQGRPTLKADAMLARFQTAGGKVSWDTYTDQEVTGTFSHPAGGSLKLTWTFAQAKSIGLTSKDNWKNYPRAMLRARVISEGIRTVYPGCVVGTYTAEELEDIPAPPKDMGMAQVVESVGGDTFVVESEGQYKLYIPGMENPYSSYDTPEEWKAAFDALHAKISRSPKYTVEAIEEKLDGLKACNLDMLDYVGSIEREVNHGE